MLRNVSRAVDAAPLPRKGRHMKERAKSALRIHQGYLVVAALVFTSFIPLSMCLSCTGIFYPPLSLELGVDKGILSYYVAILWVAALVSLPFTGRLLNNGSARVCVTGAAAAIALAFAWLSFTRSLWQFYAAAILMGAAIGMLLFLAPSTLINRWFAKRAGFLLGICMAFTGIGGMIWSAVGGVLIDAIGWSGTYLVFALLSALAIPVSLLLVSSRPEEKGLKPYGYGADDIPAKVTTPSCADVPASKAFKMPVFYAILVTCFTLNIAMPVYFMIPSYASTLEIVAIMPLLGAIASSIAMAGQTASKIVLGAVGEKHPQSGTLIALGCGILGSVLFIAISTSIPVYCAASLFFGIYYGIANVMIPLFTRASFGNADYARIYARVSMVASISNALGAFAWGTIVSIVGDYAYMFGTAAILMAITAAGVVIIGALQRREKAIQSN